MRRPLSHYFFSLGGLFAVAFSLTVVTAGSSPKGDPGIEDLLAEPGITQDGQGRVVVDFTGRRDAASRALDAAGDALEGRTVVVRGMDVIPSSERRKQDLEAQASEARALRAQPLAADALCFEGPPRGRSNKGEARPFLGCDGTTGVVLKGGPVKGPPEQRLAAALGQVATHYLGVEGDELFVVKISRGTARVDASAELEGLVNESDGLVREEFMNALLFTAYSDAQVKSIQFSLDGDCLAFAILLGGDMCGSIDLAAIPAA